VFVCYVIVAGNYLWWRHVLDLAPVFIAFILDAWESEVGVCVYHVFEWQCCGISVL
jgi:hypothetical protein